MPIATITLPPGFYKNGTPYSRKGRYEDGNLVRHHDGSFRPIGGWVRRQDSATGQLIAPLIAAPSAEAIREIFTWRDNGQASNALFFSNLAVYYMDAQGTTTDVTPAGYIPVNPSKDPDVVTGYGRNLYGLGPYGSAGNQAGIEPTPPDRWYFDAFGEIALFGSVANGPMYELNLIGLTTAAVTNAPEPNRDMCVTNERQVFVVGANGEPRRIRTSVLEDRTNWSPAVDNQSIDRTLPGTGNLLRCMNVLGQVLILGENDAHAGRYVGPPYVYRTDLVGKNCGPLCAQAAVATESFAVWWGDRNFWAYDGSVQELTCDVIDFLYDDVDLAQRSKITSFTNKDYSEIWWLYQSKTTTTTEVDSYVCWNYFDKTWYTGRIDRTAGAERDVFVSPMMVTSGGEIFNHEQEGVFPLDEGEVFVVTGPLDTKQGEVNTALRSIYPDVDTLTGMSFTVYARQFPSAVEQMFGPYPANNPTDTRALGRSLRIRTDFTQADNEVGLLRLDIAPSGAGKR